ncbi:MAG TPA: Ig-like domain-containing protein, partial [Longimicrobiales bacterium]
MRSFLRATALLAVLMTASACEDTIVKPELEAGGTFQVRPSLLRITNGDEGSLSAVAFDSDRAVFTGAVEWTSLDPEIAGVDETGRVSALTPGWARVVGTSTTAGLTDTAAVSVALRLEGVSGGYEHLCGLTDDGSAYCWGSSNSARYGVFGSGGEATYFTPNAVTGGLSFSNISAGYLHTCGLADGVPYCWGRSMRGLVSCPVFSPFGCFSPIRAGTTSPTFTHLDSSPYLSDAACASGSAGAACWGQGSQVQPINCSWNGCVGIRFPSITGDVAVGYGHACGLDASGRAYCWGNNSKGQLGAVF